jgi:hypothetical protein
MEALTRLVADSFARHGLDGPVDPRRLQWSRWFRCDSPHSLLVVPSKPGIFALAEEVMTLGPIATLGASKTNLETSKTHVGTAALGSQPRAESRGPAEQSSAPASSSPTLAGSTFRKAHDFSSDPALTRRTAPKAAVNAAEVSTRRMLAVLQFSEDDDMAFTLDRMFTRINPMRARLSTGRCFLRFAIIEDQHQRRSICTALNQWMLNSAEKATSLPADFQSSLELTTDRVGRTLLSDSADALTPPAQAVTSSAPPMNFPQAIPESMPSHLGSGAAKNLHCPHPLPSGF